MQKPMTPVSKSLPEKSGYYIVRISAGQDSVADHFGWRDYERWFDAEKGVFEEASKIDAWREMDDADRDARDDDSL